MDRSKSILLFLSVLRGLCCAGALSGFGSPWSHFLSVVECVMPVASSCPPYGAEVTVPPVILASDYLFYRCRAHEYRSAFAGPLSGACVEVCDIYRASFSYLPSFCFIIVVVVGTCSSLTTDMFAFAL